MSFSHRPVGEIVAEDYRRAGVLKRFGIDFCCGGGRTLEAACARENVSVEEVERALETADARPAAAAPARATAWPPDFLADYIVNVHHAYVRENVPTLLAFTQKVARVHGGREPHLVEIARLTEELAAELMDHLEDEERTLFPYVRDVAVARREGRAPEPPAFGTVRDSLAELEREHEHAGALLRELRRLSDDFTPPPHACNTYRASFAKLEEFEEDLHLHVHLENNVLFPKTAELEADAAPAVW